MVNAISVGTLRNLDGLAARLRILNLLYWYGGNMVIECPRHGFIDAGPEYCGNCNECLRGAK